MGRNRYAYNYASNVVDNIKINSFHLEMKCVSLEYHHYTKDFRQSEHPNMFSRSPG